MFAFIHRSHLEGSQGTMGIDEKNIIVEGWRGHVEGWRGQEGTGEEATETGWWRDEEGGRWGRGGRGESYVNFSSKKCELVAVSKGMRMFQGCVRVCLRVVMHTSRGSLPN